jgi:hypothetical protein
VLVGGALAPSLGAAALFGTAGAVVGCAVFCVMLRPIGPGRAAGLALLVTVTFLAVFLIASFGACAATGCVR